MPDVLTPEQRRKNMQAIRSTHTKMETAVARELWRQGIRFRRNAKDLLGKPDISIKTYKIAIFLDSCFWHGCELHCRIPGTNTEYWLTKINRNRQRDLDVTAHYRARGWHLLRVWEHELKCDFASTVDLIATFIRRAKHQHASARRSRTLH